MQHREKACYSDKHREFSAVVMALALAVLRIVCLLAAQGSGRRIGVHAGAVFGRFLIQDFTGS